MASNDLELTPRSAELLDELRTLRDELDAHTVARYQRVNPFGENITDWREKAARYLSEDTVVFDSATLIGDIKMGPHCWVGLDCLIDGSGGLTVGHHCVFSSGVHVYTHDTIKWALSGGEADYFHAPVTIGDCVFLSAQCVVTAGVTIGDHVLVCANATVVKDVAPYPIVAGTPARPIGWVEIDESGDVQLRYGHRDQSKQGA